MKKYLFLVSLLIPLLTSAQERQALIDLFEEREVGNLHVFANPEPTPDYFFFGTPIEQAFPNVLPGDVSVLTILKEQEPHAVFRIRGKEEELYLIRFPGERAGNEIALYGWDGDQLKKRRTLAYHTCKGNRCIQVDSWIQDLDGDTWLDLIQKRKVSRKNGQKVTVKSRLFLMNQEGRLQKSDFDRVDFSDFPMHRTP
jgi:hypothetical protein